MMNQTKILNKMTDKAKAKKVIKKTKRTIVDEATSDLKADSSVKADVIDD